MADEPVRPTSELASHLAMHEQMLAAGNGYRAAIHTHPIDLVAMTHNPAFLEKDVLTNLLWSMIPETRAFCPRGSESSPYAMPSSVELARATIEQLKEYDVVMWEKHGVCAVGPDVMEAFDQIDVLSKSAQIYLTAKSMGFEPHGNDSRADGRTQTRLQPLTPRPGGGRTRVPETGTPPRTAKVPSRENARNTRKCPEYTKMPGIHENARNTRKCPDTRNRPRRELRGRLFSELPDTGLLLHKRDFVDAEIGGILRNIDTRHLEDQFIDGSNEAKFTLRHPASFVEPEINVSVVEPTSVSPFHPVIFTWNKSPSSPWNQL